jgi:hypothetical protein
MKFSTIHHCKELTAIEPNNELIVYIQDEKIASLYQTKAGWSLNLSNMDDIKAIKIFFCPFCGKELSKENKEK